MKTYQVTVQRSGKYWAVDIRDVGPTQARHLRELDEMTYDLIAVMTEKDPDSFDVEYEFILPEGVRSHLERAEELRARSAQANTEAAAEVRAAVSELVGMGLPQRDIARLLGVSYQRVQQLARDAGSGLKAAS